MKTTIVLFVLAIIFGDACGAAMTAGNLLFVRSGISGTPLSTSSNRVYLDEYTWDGTFVQTHNPGSNCVVRDSRYTGGASLSRNNKLAVVSCNLGTPGNSISTMPRAAVTMDGTGTVIDTTSMTTSTQALFNAYVDGNDVWFGLTDSLAYLKRGATSANVSNVLSGTQTSYDMQIVDGIFYTSNLYNSPYLVAKAASIPKVAGVTVTPYITESTTAAFPGYTHVWDKNTVYLALDTFSGVWPGVIKIVDDGTGTFTTYAARSPQALGCNGVFAIDRQGTRYVYFTTDNAVLRATDTGTAFTDLVMVVTGTSTDVRYHDVVRVPDTYCFSGVKDGDESDVDCGGTCISQCANDKTCASNSDCTSMFCNTNNVCKTPTCSDGAKNQDETDVDCGGATCVDCAEGKSCLVNDDCLGDCVSNVCVATCSDTVKNQDESDIDCGGTCTAKCANDKTCNSNTDCSSNFCNLNGVCKTPTCSDGERNRDETDVDCGGSCTTKCANDKGCESMFDCANLYCNTTGFCQTPTCFDGVTNQGESDIDCGGGSCVKCENNMRCQFDTDCTSDFCDSFGYCKTPSCSDGFVNQDETGTDCGGNICPKCAVNLPCLQNADCETDNCVLKFCKDVVAPSSAPIGAPTNAPASTPSDITPITGATPDPPTDGSPVTSEGPVSTPGSTPRVVVNGAAFRASLVVSTIAVMAHCILFFVS